MTSRDRPSRILGLAFLLQFVTSFFLSGIWLKPAWLATDDIEATLFKIAEKPWLLQANILADMLTALGVIFLGAALFVTLRRQNETLALTGLGFYVLEASLLASSRMATYSLLPIGREYVAAGQPDYLLTLATSAVEAMDFTGETLHMVAFCLGASLFYALLDRSRLVPRALSLWGLITVLLLLPGTLATVFTSELPTILLLPFLLYLPFEFVIGLWILIKGVPGMELHDPMRNSKRLNGRPQADG
ncbi:MAG: DUF4386 domain-containing protein [Chloroflexota bacterium]|jgi:hypothetical protein